MTRKSNDKERRKTEDDKKPRSRIHRLLNYKRYIDWLVERELTEKDKPHGHQTN